MITTEPFPTDMFAGCIEVRLPAMLPITGSGLPGSEFADQFRQKRTTSRYWQLLREILCRLGQYARLDRMEQSPTRAMLVHFSCEEPLIVIALHELAQGVDGPQTIFGWDADQHIRHWLKRVETHILRFLSE
jgi:hypothetical protein